MQEGLEGVNKKEDSMMYKQRIVPWEQTIGSHRLKGKDLACIVVEMLQRIKKDGSLFEAIEGIKNDLLYRDVNFKIELGENIADKMLKYWENDYLPLDSIIFEELKKLGIEENEAMEMITNVETEVEIIWDNFKYQLQKSFLEYFNGRPTPYLLGIKQFKDETTFGTGISDDFPHDPKEFTMEYFHEMYQRFHNYLKNLKEENEEHYKQFAETLEEHGFEANEENMGQIFWGYHAAWKEHALKEYYDSYQSKIED